MSSTTIIYTHVITNGKRIKDWINIFDRLTHISESVQKCTSEGDYLPILTRFEPEFLLQDSLNIIIIVYVQKLK